MNEKGICEKHGEFDLREGCLRCLAERRKAGIRPEQDEMEDGLKAEGLTLVGAEESVAETAVALRPGEDLEAHGYFEEALRALDYAEKRVIATLEDNKVANDDLVIIGKLKKVMDNKRKSLLDPLKLKADAIRATYDYLMTPVLQADRITREKMTAFKMEQRRKAQEVEELNRQAIEVARKQAEMNNGVFTTDITPVDVPVAPKLTRTEQGVSGLVDHWKYRVVNEDEIPREYMMPNDAMLKAVAKQSHDKKIIKGVEFYNEPYIASRAR